VNFDPTRSGCAGDVPQSVAVAKDGAETSPRRPRIIRGAEPHMRDYQRPLGTSRCGILVKQSVQRAVSSVPANFRSTVVKHRHYYMKCAARAFRDRNSQNILGIYDTLRRVREGASALPASASQSLIRPLGAFSAGGKRGGASVRGRADSRGMRRRAGDSRLGRRSGPEWSLALQGPRRESCPRPDRS
jgi:hypothetical protein